VSLRKEMPGRIEVYHHEDFLKSGKVSTKVGAVVGHFNCTTEDFCNQEQFVSFCKSVCKQVYDADGDFNNLDKEILEEILSDKEFLETKFKQKIELTDFEYITL
jgi:hypothetical protein